MNILFYCDEYPPYITGGIGSVTQTVAEYLSSKGHNIYVIGYYPFEKIKQEYTLQNGVHIYRYNLHYRDNYIKRNIFSRLLKGSFISTFIIQKEVSFIENKIKTLIRQKNIQILELTDYYQFNKEAPNLKFQKFEIPVILRVHGSAYFIAKNQAWKHQQYIKINDSKHFDRCDYITAVSYFALTSIVNNFPQLKAKEANVIYNPISQNFLENKSNNNSSIILFIGKLIESKGCYALLKAYNTVVSKHPNVKLQLIGGGDIEKARTFVTPQYLDQVEFKGYCNHNEIKKAIDNCSFACIPTFFENFSMVALEVMARQKALIYTTRTSGKEIIDDGINGLLVDPTDIKSIEDKINFLIENESIKDKIAENAYKKIKTKFSISVISKQLEIFYSQIIKK